MISMAYGARSKGPRPLSLTPTFSAWIPQQAALTRELTPYPAPFAFTQLSRRPTVRLNTSRPGFESRSRMK